MLPLSIQTKCFDFAWTMHATWAVFIGGVFMLGVPWLFYQLVSHQRRYHVQEYMGIVFKGVTVDNPVRPRFARRRPVNTLTLLAGVRLHRTPMLGSAACRFGEPYKCSRRCPFPAWPATVW